MPDFTNVEDLLTHYRTVKERIAHREGKRQSAVVIPFRRPEPELKFEPKPKFELRPEPGTPKFILNTVAEKYKITVDELRGPRRKQNIARARREASWQMRQLNRLSLSQIAKFVGVTNHTTVLHHIKKYEEMLREGHQPKENIWTSETGDVCCAADSTTMPRSSDARGS